MLDQLKIIEVMLLTIESELRRIWDENPSLNDRSVGHLRGAVIDTINLRRKVQDARHWDIADRGKKNAGKS